MPKFIFAFLFTLSLVASGKETVTSHPLFSVPDGYIADSSLVNSEFEGFRENSFYCSGKLCKKSSALGFVEDGDLSIEGKISKIRYSKIDGTPVTKLLILRNYQNAVQQLGGKLLSDLKNDGSNLFLIEKENSKVWIIVSLNSLYYYNLTIVETAAVRNILVAGQLADQLNKQGFASLNVNFDNNKSIIKDVDKAAINEVITLLKNDLKLKLSVEGHTDNVGAAAANKSLSQARSDSLVAYMVAAGIPAGRLVAKGFGSEVPVADNRAEEGKAKNRRVELVKIK